MSLDVFQQSSFQRLSAVSFVDADAHSARFDVDGISLNVSAHAQDMLRLTFGQSQLPDYGLLQQPDAAGTLTVAPYGEGWRVSSGDITLMIDTAPLRFTVSKARKTILESITDQHFRGRTRLPAIGLHQGDASDKQPRRWCASFALNSDTAVYGFGEKFGPLDKRGQLVRGRTEDALGVNTELYDASFRALFSGSPIKRIGRNRFVRNCLYAAGTSGDPALIAPVTALLADADLVVAEAAAWAFNRLTMAAPQAPA